jgi:hypothetical protein
MAKSKKVSPVRVVMGFSTLTDPSARLAVQLCHWLACSGTGTKTGTHEKHNGENPANSNQLKFGSRYNPAVASGRIKTSLEGSNSNKIRLLR